MSHPDELLADLVDGTLDADARALLDAHLEGCSTCRSDLEAALAGREAVRRLRPALLPADLSGRIMTAAGGRDAGDAGGRTGPPTWYRWAGVAAAAALIGVIAISLPNVGDDDRAGAPFAAGSAETDASGALEGTPPLERTDENYGERDLQRLATETAGSAAILASPSDPSAPAVNASRGVGCVTQAFGSQNTGVLVRLIEGRFKGEPAFIAVYLEGPGADEPPDTVAVYAASADGCDLRSFASARL